MTTSDIAISVRNLTKEFSIAHEEKHTTLAERIVSRVKHPLRRATRETFAALKDVSFEIHKGDVVGIIGRNGSGKSTLLKLLSNITQPTRGEIDLYGRVGSLLEVGTGFHPELTGRENIFLNGAILGMRRPEIRRRFDEIVQFAEVEKFLDTPVKRYSSGMYVRLAFAVAAHLNPEILIVDEVLAVGDVEFQDKCLGKMQDVAKEDGRTVIFVSHNMAAVESLCTRGILLHAGQIVLDSPAHEAVQHYLRRSIKSDFSDETIVGKEFDLCGLRIAKPSLGNLSTFAPCEIAVTFRSHKDCSAGVHIFVEDHKGSLVFGIDSTDLISNARCIPGAVTCYRFNIESLPLITGTYRLRMILRNDTEQRYWEVPSSFSFTVESARIYGTRQVEQKWHGTTAVAATVDISQGSPDESAPVETPDAAVESTPSLVK